MTPGSSTRRSPTVLGPTNSPRFPAATATSVWHAGAARILFPIPPGAPLAGYAARTGAATTTLDDLEIAALVLDHDGQRLTLVTADVIAIDTGLVPAVAAAAGIPADRLILAASHTHSGPAGIVARLHPAHGDDINAALRAAFVSACGTVIRAATAHLSPATVQLGHADAPGVGANRNTEDGPWNDRVSALSVQPEPTGTLAVLIHFACHPTILGAESLGVSADLVGGMRRALAPAIRGFRSIRGEHPVVLFGNGAAGDISTRSTRRSQTYPEVERLGVILADGAIRALAAASPVLGPLRNATRTVHLPRKPDPDLDVSTAAARLRADSDRILASDAPAPVKRQALTRAQGAELAATMDGAAGIPVTATISAWSLGNIAILTVPGELFSVLGHQIERRSPYPTTLILGYANGHVGYLVDAAAERDGTYEALASPYLATAGDAIVREAITMLHDLHANAPG